MIYAYIYILHRVGMLEIKDTSGNIICSQAFHVSRQNEIESLIRWGRMFKFLITVFGLTRAVRSCKIHIQLSYSKPMGTEIYDMHKLYIDEISDYRSKLLVIPTWLWVVSHGAMATVTLPRLPISHWTYSARVTPSSKSDTCRILLFCYASGCTLAHVLLVWRPGQGI